MHEWNAGNKPPLESNEIDRIVANVELSGDLPSCFVLAELGDWKRCPLIFPFYRCVRDDALVSSGEPDLRCPICRGRIFRKERRQPHISAPCCWRPDRKTFRKKRQERREPWRQPRPRRLYRLAPGLDWRRV